MAARTGSSRQQSGSFAAWGEDLRVERQQIERQLIEAGPGCPGCANLEVKLDIAVSFQRTAALGALQQAAIDFMLQASETAERMRKAALQQAEIDAFKTELDFTDFRIRAASRAATSAVAGDYLAFPLLDRGYLMKFGRVSLLVIDLRTGQWCDITTGPTTPAFLVYAINEMYPVFDLRSKRLYIRGHGIDPGNWRQDLAHKDKPRRIIAAGLLAYDLDRLTFAAPDLWGKEPTVLWGRSGPVPEITPGVTTTRQLEEAMGKPIAATAEEQRWESHLARLTPDWSLDYRYETVTCRVRNTLVESCRRDEIDIECKDAPGECRNGRQLPIYSKPTMHLGRWQQFFEGKFRPVCTDRSEGGCYPALGWAWDGKDWIQMPWPADRAGEGTTYHQFIGDKQHKVCHLPAQKGCREAKLWRWNGEEWVKTKPD